MQITFYDKQKIPSPLMLLCSREAHVFFLLFFTSLSLLLSAEYVRGVGLENEHK